MVLAAHPDAHAPVLSQFSLAGKTALVTGGSRGIGRQVATGLLEAGASVAITFSSTSPEEVSLLVAKLSKSCPGRKVTAYQCDVADRESVFAVAQRAAFEFGGLDIVVANAGIGQTFPAEDYPEEEFRRMLDVNFNGVFWTAQAAAGVMKGTTNRGSIIFTASVSAILVNVPQEQAAYNASKAAVVHLAKSLAVEWTEFARVNCVSPGYISTKMLDMHPKEWRDEWFRMIPAGRMCEPAELKATYVYLASDASSYMTGRDILLRARFKAAMLVLSGANIVIDGGYTLP